MPFVDWTALNAAYCGLMWLLVVVLAVVVLLHGMPAPPAAHASLHAAVR